MTIHNVKPARDNAITDNKSLQASNTLISYKPVLILIKACQMLLTLITLAKVSAPLQVKLQPVKFTVITEVLFFITLQRTKNEKKKNQMSKWG